MDYELAKALNDAGFPQTGNGGHVGPSDKIIWRREDRVYVPTLEELIEACNGKISVLIKQPTDWLARSFAGGLFGNGSTPSEAVARLWLALHPRQ
jgi:hypothetical protein